MGLLPNYAAVSGSITLNGRELLGLDDRQLSKIRGRELGMIFQDPMSSLTPIFSVGRQLVEALQVHQDLDRDVARKRAVELLDLVGIPNAAARARSFPHEFSGGMRQRVVIAMAIANDPKVIIADEPTTALDVTVQAQILEVLKLAQAETGAALILITHDLGVVAGTADDVMVMYAGRPVEKAPVDELFARPRMPYTIGLLGAVPRVDAAARAPLVPIKGNPPLLVDLPPGCPFEPRCPISMPRCADAEPELAPAPGTTRPQRGVRPGRRDRGRPDRRCTGLPAPPGARVAGRGAAPRPAPDRARADRRQQDLPAAQGRAAEAPGGVGLRGLRDRPGRPGGRDPRPGRRVRVRQDHDAARDHEPAPARARHHPRRRASTSPSCVGGPRSVTLRRRLQMVFQDPMGSLDPRMTVFDILAEPLRALGRGRPRDRSAGGSRS